MYTRFYLPKYIASLLFAWPSGIHFISLKLLVYRLFIYISFYKKRKEEANTVAASTNGTPSVPKPKTISENGSSVETQDKVVIREALSTVSAHEEWTTSAVSGQRPKPCYEVCHMFYCLSCFVTCRTIILFSFFFTLFTFVTLTWILTAAAWSTYTARQNVYIMWKPQRALS